MIVVIWAGVEGGPSHVDTPFGRLERGEVIEAPNEIAEWLTHNGIAEVARNWRWPGEKVAPVPIPTRAL